MMEKMDNGKLVKMTAKEIAQAKREQEEWAASKPDPKTRDLTKAEFKRLLRLSGLDDVWDAVAAHLKANDRKAYADMMGELDKQTFRLDYTLGQIGAMEEIVRAIGSRVTAKDVKAHWADVATGGREA